MGSFGVPPADPAAFPPDPSFDILEDDGPLGVEPTEPDTTGEPPAWLASVSMTPLALNPSSPPGVESPRPTAPTWWEWCGRELSPVFRVRLAFLCLRPSS